MIVLGLLWAPLLVGTTAIDGACDLSPWLQEEPVDKGYHVICVGDGEGTLYLNASAASRSVLKFDDSLPEFLEELLQIKTHLGFKPHSKRSSAVQWKKQSWAFFTVAGERWTPEEASSKIHEYDYRGVLLLFEGGTWRWPGIRVGYERPLQPDSDVILRTVALKPALFELVLQDATKGTIPELLSDVVQMSEKRLQRSLTEKEASEVRTSQQHWLSYNSHPKLKQLKKFTSEVLRLPSSYFERDLQVLRYTKGQLYDAHRDYWDPREFPDEERFVHPVSKTWNMRFATLLWYLRDAVHGGETWFPRAHGGPIPYGEWTACDDRGVKMSGRNGTVAILFYSLYSSGDIDTYSWHCGCPVGEGTKWAANSWIWNQPQSPPYAKSRSGRSVVEFIRDEL
ncbi:P4H4 [Symbiodinium sp. KB8]|nr:P4H4 [Symbiodinium sp. KB8]